MGKILKKGFIPHEYVDLHKYIHINCYCIIIQSLLTLCDSVVLEKTRAINQENSKAKDCPCYFGKRLKKARSNLKAEVERNI